MSTSSRSSTGRLNVFATLDSPAVVLSTHFDCVPPFFPSDVRMARYTAGAAAMPKGSWRLRLPRSSGFAPPGSAGSDCCSSWAKSAAATAQTRPTRPRVAFLINGEPTDNRLAIATRGNLRVRLRARAGGTLCRARTGGVRDRQAARRPAAVRICGGRATRSWGRRSTR